MSVGPFQPFWIEGEGRRLYAAWHPAQEVAAGANAPAVLLPPPLLHEHYRSLRFLCEFASSLARQGLHCLRYSHTGAGDSEGEGHEADLDVVAADLGRAAAALAQCSGQSRIALVCFRTAALALPHWWRSGGRAERVIAWDPVADGRAWLQERRREDRDKRATIRLAPGMEAGDDGDLMGLSVSPRLLGQIEDAQWRPAEAPAGTPVWEVRHGDEPGSDGVDRVVSLPAAVPRFGEGVLMDASLLFSGPLERAVRALGQDLARAA